MRKIFLTLLLSFLLLNPSFSQTLTIKSSLGTDTIQACIQQQIYFYGYLINGSDTLDAYWTWDMDDGTQFNGPGLDTIRYSFMQNRGYRVFAYATYNDTTFIGEILVKIGLDPVFDGTKVDLPSNQNGICKGDQVTLIGKCTDSSSWKEHPVSIYLEPFPFQISSNISYSNAIERKDFLVNQTLQNPDHIDSIGLLIVQSNSQNLKITLTAPNGKTIILKDYGGNQNYFGDTSQGSNGANWYYWSNSSVQTINTLPINNEQIPPQSYAPDQNFDSLTGTLLNGQWTINVSDTGQNDFGYVLGWAIFFDTAIVADTFQYTNTFNFSQAYWNGDNINLTVNGQANAYPDTYGDHRYNFYVQDNFGCMHDTSVFVTVEQPDFTMDKTTVIIGDSVKIEDLTSWAKHHYWDFGDLSPQQTGKTVYHKYFDKGKYLITLTAESASGCTDQDTAWIEAVPKPIKLQNYNVFTPNGDGVNDVFSFFIKPEDKITAYNIETIDGKIYDRYGKVVCHWTTPEQAIKGWNGNINNSKIPAAEGFYYYVIIIKGKDGKKYPPFTGFIYLHR